MHARLIGLGIAISQVLIGVINPQSFHWSMETRLPLTLFAVVAVALILAAFNVYYRDFRYALPFALQLWLFASPVAYPLEVVPDRWRALYVALNPAAGVLDGFRRVLALGELPDPGRVAAGWTFPMKR